MMRQLLSLLLVLRVTLLEAQFFGKKKAGNPYVPPPSKAYPGGYSIKPQTYTKAASQMRVYEDGEQQQQQQSPMRQH